MSETDMERLTVEEIANCVTHGVGLLLSVAGFVVLVVLSMLYGDTLHVVSGIVYGASLVTLYLASTLYHGARVPSVKQFFQVLDHCCIYLLIAGTYTPFTLVSLRGGWGWTLFGLVWGIALAGILFRIIFGERYRALAVGSYILMGWLCVIAVKPILAQVPLGALAWIAAGGLAYTSGVYFFASKRIRHNHAIWHIFVLCGSICHYVAVVSYIMPAKA